jgi:class 3 adenylate cyclase/predicted ATPase
MFCPHCVARLVAKRTNDPKRVSSEAVGAVFASERLDVAARLCVLGLGQYAAAFRDNEIDERVLPSLTAEDLKELGVNLIGHRRLLLDAIAALREAGPKQAASDVPAAPPQPAARSADAERRQLTVMFCDMVGSSALSTRLDAEEQREVIAAFHTCCANEVKSLGGMVAQYLGDGVLAYFGYPTAHENDAERAILAGLAILGAVRDLKAAGEALQTRIAVGSGVVVVGDLIGQSITQENAAIGETTNLVARLQTVAEPNSLVISPVTHRLVGALFDYRDLGRHTLKGFPNPVHVRQVLGPSKVESRFEAQHQAGMSPLLGREEELDLLLRRWEQVQQGEGRVVVLTGEPGIGKSRIARALRDQISADPHTTLSYFCSPHHQSSALYPHTMQLARAASIERDDTSEVRLNKIKSLLAQSSGNLDRDMPLIAALLSIPGGDRYTLSEITPQRRKERTLEVLLEQLKRLAARHPILVVYEDLHWIDPTSLELLSLAIEQVRDQRILLVATARPEFAPPWPGHRHVSTLSLNRFGRSESEALIAGISKGKVLPPQVRDQIVMRTDGVPLFVEELTKTVLESGMLREVDNRYELIGTLPPLAIPSTLHASLLARLDRLAAVKDVAQIGAAIGREFSYTLITAVASIPEDKLKVALAQLVEAELIFQRGLPPDATYQFKHALVQDAAYDSLLKSRRQLLHYRIAEALEGPFANSAFAPSEVVGHHYACAGSPTKAMVAWRIAGERAIARSEVREAAAHFSKALGQLVQLPDDHQRRKHELELRLALVQSLIPTAGWSSEDVQRENTHAIALCEDLGDSKRLLEALVGRWVAPHTRGAHDQALMTANHMLDVSELQADPTNKAIARMCAGLTNFLQGKFSSGRDHLQASLTLHNPRSEKGLYLSVGQDFGVGRLCYLGFSFCATGHLDKALATIGEALTRAKELRHVPSLGFAERGALFTFWILRDERQTTDLTTSMSELGEKHELPYYVALSTIFRGWIASQKDDPASGIRLMRQGVARTLKFGVRIAEALFLTMIARVHYLAGQFEEGLSVLDEASSSVQETNERWWEAEVHRLRGELLHRAGPRTRDGAEECLLEAVRLARQQDAKFWELRAATSLARLWRDQGKFGEARDLLAPVYRWFTEGFTLDDLTAAKALLKELGSEVA